MHSFQNESDSNKTYDKLRYLNNPLRRLTDYFSYNLGALEQ
jgi:hypothetical protein